MATLEIILENFMFLVLEVKNQIRLTMQLIQECDTTKFSEINSKDDYIDILKSTVEDKCFSYPHHLTTTNKYEINTIRAIHIMSLNLERIADFCVNIARQTEYLNQFSFIHQFGYKEMFAVIDEAVSKIISVYQSRNLSGALEICKAELRLDELYKINFDRIMTDIKTIDKHMLILHTNRESADIFERFKQTENNWDAFYKSIIDAVCGYLEHNSQLPDFITSIFIFRYLERIGDALLNIGEALIFMILGDRIKIRQFTALNETLSGTEFNGSLSDIQFQSILGSRSGCHISYVTESARKTRNHQGIFKEGSIDKIKVEKENIERWNHLFPTIAPNIFGYIEKDEKTASLLIEFFPGCTLDEVILSGSDEVLNNALSILKNLLTEIWTRTKCTQPKQIDYIQQLQRRLSIVHRVHPTYSRPVKKMEDLPIPSSKDLIIACSDIEKELISPFSVLIHGDFNINNLIYNHVHQKINFIDFYRSKESDYIQDASVFLVSNFRLPFFETPQRDRLNHVIHEFFTFFSEFALTIHDVTFDMRMALALARSFYTSTRFEMKDDFAKNMFLRANFLMEKIIRHKHKGQPPETFILPTDVLYY
ncbi:MAG: phosphotransferase [Desulfobacterales bacterium]|nr:phosphotransferase [Desulfobacterales bacterium]